jgi:hypothetical protein
MLNKMISMNQFNVIQPIDCSTYTIVGQSACSVMYQMTYRAGGGSLGIKVQTMLLITYINGMVYYFGAGATQPNFSHILPIFFHMLSSFKPFRQLYIQSFVCYGDSIGIIPLALLNLKLKSKRKVYYHYEITEKMC